MGSRSVPSSAPEVKDGVSETPGPGGKKDGNVEGNWSVGGAVLGCAGSVENGFALICPKATNAIKASSNICFIFIL